MMLKGPRFLLLSFSLSLFLAAEAAHGCRCPQRTLAEYFDAADEVFVARLAAVKDQGDERGFEFEPSLNILKQTRKEARRYVSSTSMAACAVPVDLGAVYVVFAGSEPNSEVALLTSCDGTRVHLSSAAEAHGFEDTPPRFVISQLNALAGLEVLKLVAAHEPSAEDPANEKLVGLLEIHFGPGLEASGPGAPGQGVGGEDVVDETAAGQGGGEPEIKGEKLGLRESPEATAKVVGYVSSIQELVHRESGYEVKAAVVFAVLRGWYKVQLEGGAFGWVPQARVVTHSPLEELAVNRLSYLNENWDGFLWPQLGAGLPLRDPGLSLRAPGLDLEAGSRIERPARILESARIGGSLWFRVELLSSSPCDGGEPKVALAGWMPAYGANGEPAAWYYSRGC